MTKRILSHVFAGVAIVFSGVAASAAPIDFTTGINAGVSLNPPSGPSLTDGLEFSLPVQTYVLNKIYTAQIVPTGSTTDVSEAYRQFGPDKMLGFGSALADGRGAVEVGVESNVFAGGVHAAVSRYYTTIKNNTDEDIGFDFFFVIPEGSVEILGTRFPFQAAHARVEATIDYLLRTPDGGNYVDTTGQLFRFYVDITNEGRDGTLDRSANASVLDLSTDRALTFEIAKFSGKADLPMIPAFGELTVYYDMFALFSSIGLENLGSAFLGDPTQLVQREGARFVQRDATTVPEPATLLLMGVGLLGLPVARRRRSRVGASGRTGFRTC